MRSSTTTVVQVSFGRGATKNRFSLCLRTASQRFVGLSPYLGVITCQGGHWPVAAKHQSLRVKLFDGEIDVRLEIGGGPIGPVSGGVKARHFGVYIRILRGDADLISPCTHLLIFDGRLGKVIDDERQVWHRFGQDRDKLKMVREDRHNIE